MSSNTHEMAAALGEIEDAFKAYKPKSTSKNVHYPKDLQQLAVSALRKKINAAEIARAAGVTAKSIRNWHSATPKIKKTQSMPKAKRLKVISQRPGLVMDHSFRIVSSMAQIKLQSGVVIEVLASELTAELLRKLCELEVLR